MLVCVCVCEGVGREREKLKDLPSFKYDTDYKAFSSVSVQEDGSYRVLKHWPCWSSPGLRIYLFGDFPSWLNDDEPN